MRILVRVAIGLVLLVAVALGALALLLPRLVASDAFAERLRSAARDATGSELRWRELSVGLLPPRVQVAGAALEDPSGQHAPLEAERLDLRLALAPLLVRTVLIDSLRLDGVRVHLVRDADGVQLPFTAPAEPADASPSQDDAGEEEAGFGLAIRSLVLRGSQISLEDRAVSPATTWELSDVMLEAEGHALDQPLDLKLAAVLGSGGKVEGGGTVALDGPVDLEISLDAVALAPLAAYLGPDLRVAGSASGTVRVKGPPEAPEALDVRLTLDDADVSVADITVRGRVSVEVDLAGPLDAPEGEFRLDATQAELRYGSAFTKPVGTEATASGRLAPGADGRWGVDGMRLKIKNLDSRGSASEGPPLRAQLDAAPFELEGWSALLPALAEVNPSGRVGIDALKVSVAPLELAGRITLDDVVIRAPDRPPIAFRGALVGSGTALRSEGLVATLVDQPIGLEIEVLDLDRTPSYRFAVAAEQVDADALLTALAAKPDTLTGRISVEADVSGPLGGEREVAEAVRGKAALHMGKGRLRGVSLLRGAFDRIGAVGDAAVLAGSARGGSTLQRFYDDEFESIDGTFRIGDGHARSDDLVMVYRHYRVELRGALGLLEQALDFTGRLVIGAEVDQAVAANAGNASAAAPERVIPLAHVGGTLSAPKVALTREAAVGLAAAYALGERRTQVEEKIDERLGEGAGKEVLDVLEGLLGGRKKP